MDIKKVKKRLVKFCAFRERSPNEVMTKVEAQGIPKKEASALVHELIKEGFINTQRFANAFCHDKFELNSWGKQKIRYAISQHKLSESSIQTALDRINPDRYRERLQKLGKAKWSQLEKEDVIKKNKRQSII